MSDDPKAEPLRKLAAWCFGDKFRGVKAGEIIADYLWISSTYGEVGVSESETRVMLDECWIELLPDNSVKITDLGWQTARNWLHSFSRRPTCFISYARADSAFAVRLYDDLQDHGVDCWFAPRDLRIGAKTRQEIDMAIRTREKLLLILSKDALGSDWVEKEVETAFEEERIRRDVVLFPIRVDDSVMKAKEAWAADIRRQRNIGDFTDSQNPDAYQRAFMKLLRDLKRGSA